MALSSMTGFARAGGHDGRAAWAWELKSVNGRALEVRVRVPSGYGRLEAVARTALGKRLARGNVQATLSVDRTAPAASLRINRSLLDEVIALHGTLGGRIAYGPPTLEGLLAVRGVIETMEEVEDDAALALRAAAMEATLATALDALVAARAEEGARLAAVLSGLLDRIAALVGEAAASAEAQPEELRARLASQLAELIAAEPPLSEERLAVELAILVSRSDVREELDRLDAHLGQARALLAEGAAVGRRLDFLCQEFTREANTVCSKATEMRLTRAGLDLKAAVEQFREQIQNIE
ncbi:MAG: YicC family protein [Alphaproteobacteria bacterium]|nr:YicC family protein [Alphaproteobacteria bacterium]